jgi:hypothetical protein
MFYIHQNFMYDAKYPFTNETYESWKHVISEEVFTFVNLLPKIFEKKNKSEYNSGFYLKLPTLSVWSNMFDTIGYLHWTPKTLCNLWVAWHFVFHIFFIFTYSMREIISCTLNPSPPKNQCYISISKSIWL